MVPVRTHKQELDKQAAEIIAYHKDPEAHFMGLATQLARGVEDFRIALSDHFMMCFNFDDESHEKLHAYFLEKAGLENCLAEAPESGVIKLAGSERILVRTVATYDANPDKVHSIIYHGEISRTLPELAISMLGNAATATA